MDYLYLIIGIALLVISGNWLVKSGSEIAEHFGISPFVIGLTIIALGTSAPELFVSTSAALSGSPDIAIGNVIGSNIANIGLVLGITSIIITIPVKKSTIKLDYPFLLFSTILFISFMFDLYINMYEGIIMLFIMAIYIGIIIKLHKKESQNNTNNRSNKKHNLIKPFILIVISCLGLLYGSKILVKGAENIALSIGVSKRVVSVTLVAFGTSIPELATSVIAAFKKQIDISVGNVIGSNIFNILIVSGVTSTITPLPINNSTLNFDVYFLLGFVILTGIFFLPLKKPRISRWKGIVYILLYFIYYILLFYV